MGEDQEHIRGNRIHLRDSKTGAKTIPLNGPALEVLAGTKRVEGNPYVRVLRTVGDLIGVPPTLEGEKTLPDAAKAACAAQLRLEQIVALQE